MFLIVIPVKTGIQYFQGLLDSRLRGNDSEGALFKALNMKAISVYSQKLL
jgi:hypothetical protein